MIAYVEVEYEFTEAEKAEGKSEWNTSIPETKWKALREFVPQLREQPQSPYYIRPDVIGKLLVNLKEIQHLMTMGFKFNVVAFPGGQITTLKDRIAELIEQGVVDNVEQMLNGGHVHIHVADGQLIKMDEIQFIEDACTDLIQTELNNGWRMLAVCPPNAQRRPTYILGRKSQ